MAMRRKDVVKETPKEELVQTEAVKPSTAEPEKAQAPEPEKAQASEPEKAQVPAVKEVAAAPRIQRVKGMTCMILDDKKDIFLPEFGTLPRIKASNGSMMCDDKVIGSTAQMQVLSWNYQWIVGPNDNKAPNDLVKYSLDSKNLDCGSGTVADWVADLKSAGWSNAASKKYCEVVCSFISCDKDNDLVGEMVQLQLSPTSVKSFEGYKLQTSFKVAQGLIPDEAVDVVEVTTEVVSNNGNTWTKFNFKLVPTA